MNDALHDAVRVAAHKQEVHMENLLVLAARSGCGIDMTTTWVLTDTGYALESEVTLAPELPPYAVRDGKHLYQYAPREEGGQGPA